MSHDDLLPYLVPGAGPRALSPELAQGVQGCGPCPRDFNLCRVQARRACPRDLLYTTGADSRTEALARVSRTASARSATPRSIDSRSTALSMRRVRLSSAAPAHLTLS